MKDYSFRKKGEWSTEPDFKKFYHKGVRCFIKRNPVMGFLCGYVQIKNPLLLRKIRNWKNLRPRKKFYYLDNFQFCSVHGGASYLGKYSIYQGDEKNRIYLGFDCGRYYDYAPFLPRNPKGTYWNLADVEKECRNLCDQLINFK